jgi:hypothetical protein
MLRFWIITTQLARSLRIGTHNYHGRYAINAKTLGEEEVVWPWSRLNSLKELAVIEEKLICFLLFRLGFCISFPWILLRAAFNLLRPACISLRAKYGGGAL